MRKPYIFWGWYIVAAAVIVSAYVSGVFVYGFTAFIDPIAATFGWSYSQISIATSLRGLEAGVMNPFLGIFVDRYPARRLMFTGVIVLGIGVFWVSQVDNLLMFYLGFLIFGFGNSLCVYMVPQTAIVRWFDKDVGKASGIVAMGIGIGGILIPFLVRMIDAYGWQDTLILLALGMWVIGLPLCLIFRNRPEEYGLLPDGKAYLDRPDSGNPALRSFGTTTGGAVKMLAFWLFGIVSLVQMGAGIAVVTHIIPYLVSIGMERASAGNVAMFIPLVSLFARFPFGLLCDIMEKKYVMALSVFLESAGLIVLYLIGQGHTRLVLLFVLLFGLGTGGVMSPRVPIVREYFGTKNFGKIFGLSSAFLTTGIVAGPPLTGWVFDTVHSYQPAWMGFFILTLLAGMLMCATPRAKPLLPETVQMGID